MSLATFVKRMRKRVRAQYATYLKQTRLPILPATCLFEAGQGKNINGNMFALVRSLVTRQDGEDWDAAYVVTNDTRESARDLFLAYGIEHVELVIRNSARYQELLARARYLFTDNSFPTYFTKRADQVYVNTWHGTPLKHLGHSDLGNAVASMANVQKNILTADYVLFPNELTRRVFWDDYQLRSLFSNHVLMCDYPRNDALLDGDGARQVRKRYNLLNKNVIAYMPTWRGARRSADIDGQKAQIGLLLQQIDRKLTDHDLLYVNLHFLVTGGMDFSSFRHIRPFPPDLETYDFLAACDVLVTDYSSVFFDFASTGRKIVLFAYDKQNYLETKGTYLDYDSLPFPIVETVDELAEQLASEDYAPYDAFRREFCAHATGHTASDVLNLVLDGNCASLVVQDNTEARSHTALFLSSASCRSLNDVVRNELPGHAPTNGLFLCAGKLKSEAVHLLDDIAPAMPYLALVSSHVQTTPEKFAFFLAARNRLARAAFARLLSRMAQRELGRLLPGISLDSVIDLNVNSSYLMKLLAFSDMNRRGVLRDGSLTRLVREGATRRLLDRFPYKLADISHDRSLVSREAAESYFSPGMRMTLLTRSYENAECAVSGLALLQLARGVPHENLSLELADGTRVGSVHLLCPLGHFAALARYEARIPGELLANLPIHSQVFLTCHAADGMSGRTRVRFNVRDHRHSTSRVSRLWINPATGTTSYFRQAAKNTLCFTTRDTISIDTARERTKIALARMTARVVPVWRSTILLYEKNASRYEESASVVFERLVDEGRKNARFVIDRNSADVKRIGEKYRPYVIWKNSMAHYLAFFSARTFIGTEMLAHAIDVRPANPQVSRRLSDKGINYVFLQHGVMYMLSLDSSSRTFFRPKRLRGVYRVVVSSELEKDHFVERGGYDPSTLYVCGLPKYDRNRWDDSASVIAIMPTWRPWEYNATRAHFTETGYYRFIESAVASVPEQLRNRIIVLPHPLFKNAAEGQSNPLEPYFEDGTETYDQILRRTRLLITDYSSIAYDAFYRGANVLFFWQDRDECLENYGAHSELMIDEGTAFGHVVWDPTSLSEEDFLKAYEGPQSAEYVKRYRRIVEFHDGHNTDRLMKLMSADGLV